MAGHPAARARRGCWRGRGAGGGKPGGTLHKRAWGTPGGGRGKRGSPAAECIDYTVSGCAWDHAAEPADSEAPLPVAQGEAKMGGRDLTARTARYIEQENISLLTSGLHRVPNQTLGVAPAKCRHG